MSNRYKNTTSVVSNAGLPVSSTGITLMPADNRPTFAFIASDWGQRELLHPIVVKPKAHTALCCYQHIANDYLMHLATDLGPSAEVMRWSDVRSTLNGMI